MRRRHRHHSYSISADDGGRDLRIFISSLVIGLCLGAFGVYYWAERPNSRQIAFLQAELANQTARATTCGSGQAAIIGQREELQSLLSSCKADLARARLIAVPVAGGTENSAPPLPKAPPAASRPDTEQQPSSPPPPPAMPSPEASPAEPVATPVEPVPPPAPWPDGFPPQPRIRPSAPPVPEEQAAAEIPSTSVAPAQITLNVGEEKTVGEGRSLRLVAVSRRTNGRYCVLSGNNLESVRVAAGSSKTVSWAGQRISLGASVQDNDTCRISIRPSP